MTAEEVVGGIEPALFGPVPPHQVDTRLDHHLRERFRSPLHRVLFRSGRVSAVHGCRLGDGRDVAAKVHHPGADLARLHARAPRPPQRRGAGATPPRRPRLPLPPAADPVLREPLRAGAPAWARYERGPWPPPHDPVLDLTRRTSRSGWVDDLAAEAAGRLNALAGRGVLGPGVIGHSDWQDGNVRVGRGGDPAGTVVVSAAYDWDSLAARPEAVLVGMCAGSHTAGGAANAVAPTPAQVAAFLDDYRRARPGFLVGDQWTAATAAACWVVTHDARCEVSPWPPGRSRWRVPLCTRWRWPGAAVRAGAGTHRGPLPAGPEGRAHRFHRGAGPPGQADRRGPHRRGRRGPGPCVPTFGELGYQHVAQSFVEDAQHLFLHRLRGNRRGSTAAQAAPAPPRAGRPGWAPASEPHQITTGGRT